MSSIKILRLLSGEEIVALVKVRDNGDYDLETPFAIMYDPQSKQIRIGAWTLWADKVTINGDIVVFCVDAIDEVKSIFNQATGKLVTPPKPKIILPS
jgi:hypothetical protein